MRGWDGKHEPLVNRIGQVIEAEQSKSIKITRKGTKNDLSVDRKAVNSKEYREYFDSLPVNKNVADALHKEAIRILEHRDGTEFETLSILDARTGRLVVSSTCDLKLKSRLTDDEMKIFNDHEGKVVLIHNHPQGGRLSHTDLITAIKSEKTMGVMTVGHDGYVGYAKIIKHDKDIADKWEAWYNDGVKIFQHKDVARRRATDMLYKEGLIEYYENGKRI